ncbi:MAG: efflux RND transporter permease subunit [Dongiaceae bacterium]
MKLSSISITRPVFATVMSLLIILVGIVSYQRLSVREYPKIDEPSVSVTTVYPGASAEIMESQITKIIEDSLAGIEGIKTLSSVSREGASLISIIFVPERDPDSAASDVRDRVARVRGQLPDEIEEPIIAKVQADSDPIMYVVMRSGKYTPTQLTDFADRLVQKPLQTVPGVADATIFGERRYAMRIWLDPVRLAGHGVTVQDVENALRAQNLDVPTGRIEGAAREFTVLTNTDLRTVDEFNQLIIANRGGHLLRLQDVGRASLGVKEDRISFRYNSKNSVGLGIVKQATANPLEISDNIRKILPQIKSSLPEGVEIDVGYDSSIFINNSIKNVYRALIEATLLVAAVIFLFLRSGRSTLIPLVTIPVSLIGAFAIMAALGFTINTLTLLAMVLAIGLVVDDAIVMLENIYRHIEEGMKPKAAALKGAGEIGFAVVAMTLTLAAVYLPIAFMTGRTGKLFTEFALALAGAVVISGFVALTLSPMMCGLILRPQKKPNRLSRAIGDGLNRLDHGYRKILTGILKARILVFPVLLLVAALTAFVFTTLPSELAPLEDRGAAFVAFIGPEGATTDYMSAYARQIEDIFKNVPEIDRYGLVAGIGSGRLPVASNGFGFMGFTDWGERERNAKMIVAEIGPKLFGIPGVLAFPILPASLGANFSSKPVEFVIKDVTYESLAKSVPAFLEKIHENPNLIGVDSDLRINTPQLRIYLNRDLLADLGISVAEVGRTLESLLASRQVTRFKQAGEQYDVMVQIERDLRSEPGQLDRIFLRAGDGSLIPLSSVARIESTVAPRELNHFDRMRAVKVTANLAPGYSLGEALSYLQSTAKEILPPTSLTALDGQSREFVESSGGLYFVFFLALVFIFLVLAAQFESFIDPITIMITVPLTMLGAMAALKLTGNTLNIYSQIGLITLVGLITKHGILIVEFANHQQAEGHDKTEAVIRAAALRLRPILMTTAATILGALPLAIAHGAGAESRQVLGWVIVGGMSIGTLLTLFVVPPVYTFLARDHRKDLEDQAILSETGAALRPPNHG